MKHRIMPPCHLFMPNASRAAKSFHGFGRVILFWRRWKIQFDSEIAALAPAEVKVEPAMLAGKERQHSQFAPGHREIPAAVRVGIPLRISAAADECFVPDADDVMIKIVEWIAEMPQKKPAFGIRPIPRGRLRIVNVPKPPDRIELVVKMDFRQIGFWRDNDGVPSG